MKKSTLDRRRKYYLVFDCETATLPCASEYAEADKKKIAIAKPLIYDFGYTIIDRKGKIYLRKNWLVTEIFSTPSVFNTAYYAHKRPIYLEKLKKGLISLDSWDNIIAEFEKDLELVESVGAYNSMFDYKKAIPFTERYIQTLYSPDFHEWERKQKWVCDNIVNGKGKDNENFDCMNFHLRNKKYSLFDIWGLACEHILNCDSYREMASANNWISQSGKYYSTTAENCYRFLTENFDFDESHTAIEDCEIEGEILARVFEKVKPTEIEMGIIYFPFRIVGRVKEW